jgi:hypothetical protein
MSLVRHAELLFSGEKAQSELGEDDLPEEARCCAMPEAVVFAKTGKDLENGAERARVGNGRDDS